MRYLLEKAICKMRGIEHPEDRQLRLEIKDRLERLKATPNPWRGGGAHDRDQVK